MRCRIELDSMTEEQLIEFRAFHNQLPNMAKATKEDYQRCLKQFFLWYEEYDDRLNSLGAEQETAKWFYKALRKIKIGKTNKQVDPREILHDEEIDNVIELGCRSIKEKAFVKALHETGARIGEFLNIRIGDIEIKQNSALFHVDGKTGKRGIPIVKSVPYLVQWLEMHPYKTNNQAYLWLGENHKFLHEPIHYVGACKLLQRCFKRAGLTKKNNPHHFRHSRASLMAPHLTESVLCKLMGWHLGSKQVRTYVHLCSETVENAILQHNGIQQKQEEKKVTVQPCVCGLPNTPTARYCVRCGNPLSVTVAVQDKERINEEINKTMQFFMQMIKDPVLMKAFQEFKDKVGK